MDGGRQLNDPQSSATMDSTAPRLTRLSSGGDGNLLVAGLLRSMTEDDLRRLFEPFGTVVRAMVMLDPVTAQSRGYGFVLMERAEHAEAARLALHGAPCGPNRLNVRKSLHDGRVVESNAVFVRNVPTWASEADVARRFAIAGPVRSAVFTPFHHRAPGEVSHAQAAYVEYDSIEQARTALTFFHLRPFDESISHGALPQPLMLVKFAERYTERKQRQQEVGSAKLPHSPPSGHSIGREPAPVLPRGHPAVTPGAVVQSAPVNFVGDFFSVAGPPPLPSPIQGQHFMVLQSFAPPQLDFSPPLFPFHGALGYTVPPPVLTAASPLPDSAGFMPHIAQSHHSVVTQQQPSHSVVLQPRPQHSLVPQQQSSHGAVLAPQQQQLYNLHSPNGPPAPTQGP